MRLPPIQETIHWLEVGAGARALRIIVGTLTLLVVTLWFDFFQMRNFTAPDAMETAQLARAISRGDGFTTQVVRPLTLEWVDNTQGLPARLNHAPHPDLFSPPLYPLLLAGSMMLLPFEFEIEGRFWRYQPEMLIAALNQAMFFLTAWLAYRLGRRLISGEAGVLLAILLLASELLWRFTTSGHSTVLLLLLMVGLLWVVVLLDDAAQRERRGLKRYLGLGALAGVVLGLMGLTRYSTLVLLIPVTLYVVMYLDRKALPTLAMMWIVCAVLVAPWLIRNHQLSGTWFGVPGVALYEETMRFPGSRLERSFEPEIALVENIDLLRKTSEGVRQAMTGDLLKPGGGWFGAFFLVGLIGQYANPTMSRLRGFMFISLAVLTLTQSLFRTHLSTFAPVTNSENLLVLLTPGMFLVGVGFYYWLLQRLQLPFQEFRHVISSVLVLGTAAPLLIGFLPPRTIPIVYPPYYPPHLQEVCSYLKPSELLVTDMPWATAWYGDRTSVWVPLDEKDSFFRIHDDQKAVSGLLLTPLTTDAEFRRQILQSRDHAWSRFAVEVLLRTNVPTRFPLRQAWSYGAPDHLFLSDLPRWAEKQEPFVTTPSDTRAPGARSIEPEPTEVPNPRPGVPR